MRIYLCLLLLLSLSSCTVTNNFYVNNAYSIPDSLTLGYGGISTGTEVVSHGKPGSSILWSDSLKLTPILSVGCQKSLGRNTDVRFALHFPGILGGIGGRLGFQHSMMPAKSNFNVALGIDLSITAARDSIKILGNTAATENATNGAFNIDVFVPITFRLSDKSDLTITPRYSYNHYWLKREVAGKKAFNYVFCEPVGTIGYRYKWFYAEASGIYMMDHLYPVVGVGYVSRF